MALYITDECTNCGACEPECPNEAIHEGPDLFVIDAALCTECVGFGGEPACVAVCPVESFGVAPMEDDAVLLERARRLHPALDLPLSASHLPAPVSTFRSRRPA